MLTAQSMLAGGQSKETQEEPSIAELRQISLSEGKIFDRYVIPFEMSPVLVEYLGGIEQARKMYKHLHGLQEESKGNAYMDIMNGSTIQSVNFGILTDTMASSEKVASLEVVA